MREPMHAVEADEGITGVQVAVSQAIHPEPMKGPPRARADVL